MLYQLHDLKNAALWPTHAASETAQTFLDALDVEGDKTAYRRIFKASNEFMERGTRIYTKPEFGIKTVIRGEETLTITESHPFEKAFCRLKKFDRHATSESTQKDLDNDPIVLIVAPLSGHFSTLLRDTVRAMIPHHQTYITDWMDAKNISLSEGEFTLEIYIDYLLDMMRALYRNHGGRRLHLIAVCQPSVPVLVATSLLAAYNEPCQPHSMTLMGGPIDTRVNPGVVNIYSNKHPLEWFARNVITTIPSYYKGAGRKVCPGFILLGGFMSMNLDKHNSASFRHLQHLVRGDNEGTVQHRAFYDEYRSMMDVPGAYFLDSLYHAFMKHSLPLGQFMWRGYKIDPGLIKKTGLFTVEGELDDISCPGQTLAAHDLCVNIPASRKKAHIQKGVGHYGIFNGRRWREVIQPKIAKFMRTCEGK